VIVLLAALGLAAAQEGAAGSPAEASVAEAAPPTKEEARRLLDHDAAGALAAFDVLLARDSADAGAVRGRAEALGRLGRHGEAQSAWESAAALQPEDPWAPLGVCGSLADQGLAEGARSCVDALPVPVDDAVAAVVRALSARLYRDDAQRLLGVGNRDGARTAALRALELERSPWSLMALGAVYLRDQDGARALEVYDEAARLAPDDVDPWIGRAAALVELGQDEEAVQTLRALLARIQAADATKVTRALTATLALRETLVLHARGDHVGARSRLEQAAAEVGPDVDLLCARATVEIAAGDGAAAWEAAQAAMALAPTAWARQVLVGAARASGHADDAAATLERLAGFDAQAVPERDAARLDTRLEAALGTKGAWRARLLRAAERDVRNGTVTSPDRWSRLGYALLATGHPRRALRAFEEAVAAHPDDGDARVARAHALLALGRPAAAERSLAAPERSAASTGGASAEGAIRSVRTREVTPAESARRAAEEDLVRAEAALVRGDVPAAARRSAALDRGTARWIASGAASLDARTERMRGPATAAYVAGLSRGRPGVGTDLFALVTPVRASAPVGAVRVVAEAAPVYLSDVDGTDAGAGFAVGVDSSPLAEVILGARAGLSPVGFAGGTYPTWGARLAWRVTPAFSLSFETGRAPRTDSRAAWAGVVYAPTQQLYGRASQVWGGVEASTGTERADAGVLVRGGYLEGIGVAPNPTAEVTAWLGRRAALGPVGLRFGLDGVAMGYARSDAGFVPTDAGAFSPPLFATAAGRVGADVGGARWAVCAGAGAGPRYRVPDGAPLDAGAVSMLLSGNAGAALTFPGRWRLVADVRGERASTDWQQLTAVAHVAWGARPPYPVPAAAALGAPGFSLPPDGALCAPRGDR
jgi:tetratricopeptide (TPR) repeat protein